MLAFEGGGYHLRVDMAGKFLRSDGYRLNHILGHVVALVVVVVEIGVFLRQDEGLVGLAVLVEIGDVEAGVSSVIAAAGVEYPSSVARP